MRVTFTMVPVAERLPAMKQGGLTSEEVLVLTEDGYLCSGNYHYNGWFYTRDHYRALVAGPEAQPSALTDKDKLPRAVSWAYVDDYSKDNTPDPVTDDLLYDVLITAFEGGCNHWIRCVDYVHPTVPRFRQKDHPEGEIVQEYASYPLTEGGAVMIITDDEPKVKHRLDREALRHGIRVMIDKYPKHYADLVGDNHDAETADVLVQCSVLGDIVYG